MADNTIPTSPQSDNWISVNDRLPEVNDNGYSDNVLVVVRRTGLRFITLAYLYCRDDKPMWLDVLATGEQLNVICWQPLPEMPRVSDG